MTNSPSQDPISLWSSGHGSNPSVVQILACDWVALIDVPFMDKCRLRTVNWTFGRAFLPFMMNDDYTKKSGEMMVEEPFEAIPGYGAERDAQHTLELIGRLSDLDVRTFFFFWL